MTACRECGTPASKGQEDNAVTVQVLENRVVFTVQGTEAVKRLFPIRPDTVRLSRMLSRGSDEEHAVRVKH